MRFTKFFALALGVAFLVVWAANGQPPPGGGGKGGPKGKGGKNKAANTDTEQLLDDLKLTDAQRAKAREAIRTYDDKMREAARQARAELLVQMKEAVSESDYKTFKEELDQVALLPTIPPNLRTIATDDLVERLMSYDKNGDGKVTKDELPERMHGLIEQGDRNGDGALDREEIRRLAERGGPGQPGRGPPGGPRPPGPPPE
jgi:Ca2+-binding EF-hand superfamily protein